MVSVITVGPFQENCYLLVQDGELAIFDPGDEAERLMDAIDATGARPRYIVLTHAHLDHVGACDALRARYDVPVYCPRGEAELLALVPVQCQMFGLPAIEAPAADHFVDAHTELPLGRATIKPIPTPGHSPGGMTYRVGDHLFVGDTIFAGGVGRTDLWGGSWPTLEASIRERIFPLEDHLTMYPGHGPTTTVGEERTTNPFFN
jgi:glyoxylase-like metal-dependent hydrolase (beta-lactamase superfamily II)